MPKRPNGEKRPVGAIGCAVMVADIATWEQEDTGYVSKNRRKSGVACAKARLGTIDAVRRSEIAVATEAVIWSQEEATMKTNVDACEAVAALYKEKAKNGLIDVKFFVDDAYKATKDAVCREVLRLEEAIQQGNFEPLVFNDRH